MLIPFREIPGPPGLPLLGHLHRIRLDRLHLILEAWAERYGPIFRIRMGPRHIAVISDRSAIHQILMQRPDTYRRNSTLQTVAEEMGLNGVFVAEGADWHRQRSMLVSALERSNLRDFFPTLALNVTRLQKRWEQAAEDGEAVDLCRDLMRFTVDVTMQFALGVDANTLETPGPVIQRHLDRVFPVLFRRLNAPFAWWRHFRLPSDRALDEALEALRHEVSDMVRDARERMASDPRRYDAPANYLEAILAAASRGVSGVTDAEIFANIGNLLLAGEDTTANSIAWTVYYFLNYPAHFTRARREVDTLVAPEMALSTVEQAARLPFLDAFCDETMRLRPVAPLHLVEPVSDVELLDYLIPKGTPIMMLARRMATQEEYFGEARGFDPDRWLLSPEERSMPHDRRAFVPFGHGPRVCPGRGLALLQMRSVLAMLCRNFDLEPACRLEDVRECLEFTMLPTDLHVRFMPRRCHQ